MSGDLPQNLHAEEYVLGALLIAGARGAEESAKVLASVRQVGLTSSDFFYAERHGFVFESIEAAVARGKSADFLIVAEELRREGRLDTVGGEVRLVELGALATATANAPHHARLVRAAAVRRDQLRIVGKMSQAIYDGGLTSQAVRQLQETLQSDPEGGRWLRTGADLLASGEPGPTPFAIEGLLVEGAIAALQGAPKATKTWLVLDAAIAIVVGQPMFGQPEVSKPGPVIVILEESGERALHRRLALLAHGRRLTAADLDGLHYGANLGVRLNESEWQARLLVAAREIRPRAIFFDPLARLKGASVDENAQREIAPVLDFMRDLREESGAAVVFVQHTGHGETRRMRGSSDLEAYWETKLAIKRDDEDGTCTLTAEHREAEAAGPIRYRLVVDDERAALERVVEVEAARKKAGRDLAGEIETYLRDHPQSTTEDVRGAVRARADTVKNILASDPRFEEAGRRSGTNANAKCWRLREQPSPETGKGSDGLGAAPGSDSPSADPSPPVGGRVAGGAGCESPSRMAEENE